MRKSETHFSLFSTPSLSGLPASPTLFRLSWKFSAAALIPPACSLPFSPLRLVSRRMLHNVSGVQEKFMDANFM